MKYTEEEKQAIEDLRKTIDYYNERFEENGKIIVVLIDNFDVRNLFVLLNLLEKYQKEIDSLEIELDDKETELQILKDDIEADEIMYKSELEESYISKEVIRNKIEELQEELKSYEEMNMGLLRHELILEVKVKIRTIKELLGGNRYERNKV